MQPGSRVAEMKLLNKQRWDAHVAAREKEGIPLEEAATGGALFNRPNPIGDRGYHINPYLRTKNEFEDMRGELTFVDRRGLPHGLAPEVAEEIMKDWHDPRFNPKRYVPVYGHDFTSIGGGSHRKYRIPETSVVNKVGDLKLFCCIGWRLTAAQWIWCAFMHSNLLTLTLRHRLRRRLSTRRVQWISGFRSVTILSIAAAFTLNTIRKTHRWLAGWLPALAGGPTSSASSRTRPWSS